MLPEQVISKLEEEGWSVIDKYFLSPDWTLEAFILHTSRE